MSELLLLGTGSADGWPNPFCACASCVATRAAGDVRGQTAALVDGTLLLDCGPEAPWAAARVGCPLDGVRAIALTHADPDHVGPAALQCRSSAGRVEALELVGPGPALAACRDRIGRDDPVRPLPVAAGDRLDVAGYAVRVLAAGDRDAGRAAVLYDVTGPDGSRLLYAPTTGPLPAATVAATGGAAYDLVLLDETFGDADAVGAGHLDLTTFPAQLAALRASGAILEGTDVVAVHLSHRNPPPAELARRLAAWGARIVPDGTALDVGARRDARPDARPEAAPPDGRPRRVLVLGGARSGKSQEAERLLAAHASVTYVATGGRRPGDGEWAARVAAHRARRPPTWTTVETSDVSTVLRSAPGPVLVDCVSLWLAAVLDETGVWDGEDPQAAQARVDELVASWRDTPAYAVAVSNEVGSGVVPASASGRRYRDELGRLNARLADAADAVLLVVAGQVLTLKGDR